MYSNLSEIFSLIQYLMYSDSKPENMQDTQGLMHDEVRKNVDKKWLVMENK